MYLFSCDFESLNTNNKPDDAVDRKGNFLQAENLIKSKHLSIEGLKIILMLIFKNNIFTINNQYYLQKVGLPMGCICGPTIANLFLFIIESVWINNKTTENLIFE